MRQITDLDEIKALELGIAGLVDEFCTVAGIQYFLAYGTLIGALRHQGFIPWDDDIDLWMLRSDYDRFVDEFPAWGKDHGLFLNSFATTSRYNRVFAKVCDAHTRLVETDRVNDFREGAFIDVFPVDGLPAGGAARFVRLTELQLAKVRLLATTKKNLLTGDEPLLKRVLVRCAAAMLGGADVEREVAAYERVARKSAVEPGGEVTFATTGKLGRNRCAPAEYFAGSERVPFEDLMLPVPSGADELLRGIYGDYMQLPPEGQRTPHHAFELWALEDEGEADFPD